MEEWLGKIYKIYSFAIDLETSSLDAVDANLVGISLAIESGIACYIPVGHIPSEQKMRMTKNFKDTLARLCN